MEFSDEYLTPQDIFFQNLEKRVKNPPDIYLFDLGNEHGKDMYHLIKNPLYEALYRINVIWIKITSVEDFYSQLQKINWQNDNSVLCIPFSWNLAASPEDAALVEKMAIIAKEHPIVIASGDEYFNKTFDFCIIADRSITWGTNIDNQDKTITGTSAYTCLLAILALGGPGYVLEQKEIIDTVYQ